VNAVQASKRTMHGPTRLPYRGRLTEMSEIESRFDRMQPELGLAKVGQLSFFQGKFLFGSAAKQVL